MRGNEFVVVVLLLALFGVCSTEGLVCVQNTTYAGRLPTNVIPTHYFITLDLPDPESPVFVFDGRVDIDVTFYNPLESSCIVISSSLLTFTEQNVTLTIGSDSFQPESVIFNATSQLATIHFDRALPKTGTAGLTISYSALVNTESAVGLFWSPNTWQNSPLLHMYATQFEAFGARTVFPGWDEPAFKATFQYQLSVPDINPPLTVLANTKETSIVKSDDRVVFNFEKTKIRMSSYLVAFSVGVFDYVEQNDNGIRFRIYTPPGCKSSAEFALNVTVRIVDHFGKLFGLSYFELNSKMDQISAPNLFQNAMENQGLLIYYPPFLLLENATSQIQQELISLVVVHEISHQWYGDTITCPWWTEEYLQEGFARYFQYSGTEALFPEWNVWTQRIQSAAFGDISYYGWPYTDGLLGDYLGTSPPVVVLDENKHESSVMLYEKGASVNRMIELFIGKDNWEKCISSHVLKHKYTNPNVYNLMDDFEAVVPGIADKWFPWLTQNNFPVVTVELDKNRNTIVVEQLPISPYVNQSYVWWIPLQLQITNKNKNVTNIFTEITRHRTEISVPADTELVEGNYNFTAFVVVNYRHDDMFDKLIDKFTDKDNLAAEIDRTLFIRNVLLLTQMSFQKVTRLLHLTTKLNDLLSTTDLFDYASVLFPMHFSFIFNNINTVLLNFEHIYHPIAQHLVHSLEPLIKSYGWSGSDSEKDQLRGAILFWAVFYGDEQISAKARSTFDSQPQNVPEYLQQAVYFAAAEEKRSWDELLKLYNNVSQSNLVTAIVGGVHKDRCHEAIEWISNTVKADSDAVNVLAVMMKYNRHCRDEAWREYRNVAGKYWSANGSAVTSQVIGGFGGIWGDVRRENEVLLWLSSYLQYVTDDAFSALVTKININMDLVDKQ